MFSLIAWAINLVGQIRASSVKVPKKATLGMPRYRINLNTVHLRFHPTLVDSPIPLENLPKESV